MAHVEYLPIYDPRRFRLTRTGGNNVEAKLIGRWRMVPDTPDEFLRGDQTVGFNLRLEDDGREVTLTELMQEWGDETVGLPDYDG